MDAGRLKKYLYIFFGILIMGFVVKEALSNGDFKVFSGAAKLLFSRKSPYNEWIFVTKDHYCLFFYSPLFALILIPFCFLPEFIPNFLWLLANVYFLYRIWILLTKYIDINLFSDKQLKCFLFICVILNLRFVLYNFGMIQMTIFILWGSLESLFLFEKKKIFAGGILLSIIINIKILPIVLIPYLIYRREFKGFLCTIIFSIIFLFIPAIFFGWSFNIHLLQDWWKMINPSNANHIIETDIGLHSLSALIPMLLDHMNSILQNHLSFNGNETFSNTVR